MPEDQFLVTICLVLGFHSSYYTLVISPGQRGASAGVVAILAGDSGLAGLARADSGLAGMMRADSGLAGLL